jgi:hypothetical protein
MIMHSSLPSRRSLGSGAVGLGVAASIDGISVGKGVVVGGKAGEGKGKGFGGGGVEVEVREVGVEGEVVGGEV